MRAIRGDQQGRDAVLRVRGTGGRQAQGAPGTKAAGLFADSELTVFLVAHSHWDREWYVPFEVFRARLADLLDGLLPRLEGEYPDFVLDGQAVVLEDYLELRPEEAGRVRRLVEAGRLRVGPFYVLPDEFLVSGEALVRNLERGLREPRAARLGYVPDSFGHVSQMPQVLRGFGLDGFLFTRGLGEGPVATAYRWEGADGSEVLALQQVRSYSHVGRLPTDPEEAADRLEAAVAELSPNLSVPAALLCHGGDHFLPAEHLPEVLRLLRGRGRYREVRSGGFEDYARFVASLAGDLPRLRGELRGGRLFPLLPGVLSARVDLKQANYEAQLLLERRAEPLDVLAGDGDTLRPALLDRAWKLLLLNHPHDSLCGCSADEVHRENLARFGQVRQLGEEVVRRALDRLTRRIHTSPDFAADRALLVWNPSPFPRREAVVAEVDLQPGEVSSPVSVWDGEGNPVPCQVLSREAVEGHHPFASAWPVDRLRLAFLPPAVPGLGWQVVYLRSRVAGEALPSVPAVGGAGGVSNGLVEVRATPELDVDLGDVRVLHRLSCVPDRGDTYNFAPGGPPAEVRVDAVEPGLAGPVLASLRVRGEIEGLGPFVVTATVAAGCARVDFRTEVEVRGGDCRLRVLFPPGEDPGATWSHVPFALVRRPTALPDPFLWRFEAPPDHHPVQWACGAGPLAVFPRGMAEYAWEDGALALTLLRSVRWLSREGLSTRRVEAGPKIPVPDALLRGRRAFEYGISAGGDLREAERFQLPLSVHEVPMRPGVLPSRRGFLEWEGPAVLSALRRVGDEVEVRVWNPTGEPAALPPGRRVDLAGRPVEGSPGLGPGEIATLRLDSAFFKG